jgi:cell division septation protein DedD
MKLFFISIFIFASIISNSLYSQNDIVKKDLRLIADGRIDDVKKQVPELLARYRNDPGVMLLQGIVIDDAALAIGIFEKIVKDFPKSEWADDAQWRIVQYYAMTYDVNRAKKELGVFKKNFPNSEYLYAASDIVRFAEKNAGKAKPKNKELAVNDEDIANQKSSQKVTEKLSEPEKDEKQPILTKIPIQKKSSDELYSKSSDNISEKSLDKTNKKNDKTTNKTEIKNELTKSEPNKKSSVIYYGIQVGAYNSEEAAINEKERFRKSRLAAGIINKKVEGKLIYSVVIGNYSTRTTAEQHVNEIKKLCNCEPMVVEKNIEK